MLKWTMDSEYKISMWGFYKNVFLVFYYFHNTKNKFISVTEYVYVCCMKTDTEFMFLTVFAMVTEKQHLSRTLFKLH